MKGLKMVVFSLLLGCGQSASFFSRAGPNFTKQYHNSAFISVRLSCTLSFK